MSSTSEHVELYDRSRLLVDLDEATDPDSVDSLLVVVALRGLGETAANDGSDSVVSHLRERFVEIVGDAGAVYCTRSTELCAIVDGGIQDLAQLLTALDGFVHEAARIDVRVLTALVEMPREATEAPEALGLADRRLSAADAPIRND